MSTLPPPGRGRRPRLAGSVAPVLGIIALAVAQLWPGLSRGLSPPISWDHGAHLGKAFQTANELLPALRGWTDLIELGAPLNTLYGIGGTLWVLLFRIPTFFLDWTQTYAVAFAAFRCVVGLTAFRLARVGGAGRAAAFLGAVFALADTGDHSEGGWFYDVLYGVWPMSLAMCFLFLGLADLVRALERGSSGDAVRWPMARAALLLGAAFVTHQMGQVGAFLLVPLLLVTRFLDGEREQATALRRIVVVAVLSGLLAAFFMLPMLARLPWLDVHGQLYRSVAETGEVAVRGELLRHRADGTAWSSVLMVLGIVLGLFARGPRRWMAFGAVVTLLIGAYNFLGDTDLLRVSETVGRIMYPRFMMLTKPLGFALAALVLHDLFARIGPPLWSAIRTPRGLLGVACALLLLAPFAKGALRELDRRVLEREQTYTATLDGWEDFLRYAAWMRSLPSRPFFRVAYHVPTSHIFRAAAAYTGKPAHDSGPLVGEGILNTTTTVDPEALRQMSVRYFVSWGPPPRGIARTFRRVRTFGPIEVYELPGARPQVAVDPTGEARPRVLSWERDRVVIDPDGARVVVVRRAMCTGWTARADGRVVEIEPVGGIPDSPHLRVMEIDLPAGTRRLVVEYGDWLASDVLGWLLTVLGLIGTALVAWPRLRPAFVVRRLEGFRLPWPLPRWTPAAVALLVVAGVLFVLVRLLGRYDFVTRLDEAVVTREESDGRRTMCTEPTAEGGVLCGPHEWQHVSPMITIVDGRIRQCLWAHPTRGSTLRVTYPEASLGSTLRVAGGIADDSGGRGGRPGVTFRVVVDGEARATLDVPNGWAWVEREIPVEPGDREVAFEVTADDDGRRFFCFEAVSP